jgi:flagellar biosynthesis protein FlhG
LAPKAARTRKIIAVGGGKGGIGKTMLSANLGVALAKAGHRVVLVDADLGGANLHTALGVTPPKVTLSDFVLGRVQSLEEVMVPSGVEGLRLIAGAMDVLTAADPQSEQKQHLLNSLQQLDADYVLLDLAAGTSTNVVDFFLIADHAVLVVLPEPTSIENAYRFVKAAFFRKLHTLAQEHGFSEALHRVMSTGEGAVKTPFDFVARMQNERPELGQILEQELNRFRIRLVVNQARTPADQQVGSAVVAAWKKFFGLEMDWLGAITYSEEAWKAVRKKRPFLLDHGQSAAANGVLSVAKNLMALDEKKL